MCLKIILFVILCYYFGAAQALNKENTTHSKLIARQYMFQNDAVELSIVNMQIVENSPPPLMMISVMTDKTLGYNFYPFFPYLKMKLPDLDLNAAAKNQHFISSPSTVVFEIDFTNETLVTYSSSSSARVDSIVGNQTEMRLALSKNDEILFYNLSFVLFIDSEESSGLYTLYLHSNSKQDIPMRFYVNVNTQSNFNIIWSVVLLGAYCLATFLLKIHYIITSRLIMAVEIIFCLQFPVVNLFALWLSSLPDIGNNQPFIASEHEYYSLSVIIGTQLVIFLGLILVCLNFWKVTSNYANINWKFNKIIHLFLWMIMSFHFGLYITTIERTVEHNILLLTNFLLLFLLIGTSRICVMSTYDIEWVNFMEPEHVRTIYRHSYYNITACFFIAFSKIILATMVFFGVPYYLFRIEVIIRDILFFMFWRVVCSIRAECIVYTFNRAGDAMAAA